MLLEGFFAARGQDWLRLKAAIIFWTKHTINYVLLIDK